MFAADLGEGRFYGAVYGLVILLGMYLAMLPFIVQTPLFVSPVNPAVAMIPGNPILASHPGPIYPYTVVSTPPHRPNLPPITPPPRLPIPGLQPAGTIQAGPTPFPPPIGPPKP